MLVGFVDFMVVHSTVVQVTADQCIYYKWYIVVYVGNQVKFVT